MDAVFEKRKNISTGPKFALFNQHPSQQCKSYI